MELWPGIEGHGGAEKSRCSRAVSSYRVRSLNCNKIINAPQPKLIGIHFFPINWGDHPEPRGWSDDKILLVTYLGDVKMTRLETGHGQLDFCSITILQHFLPKKRLRFYLQFGVVQQVWDVRLGQVSYLRAQCC